jgi:hypothetical protein
MKERPHLVEGDTALDRSEQELQILTLVAPTVSIDQVLRCATEQLEHLVEGGQQRRGPFGMTESGELALQGRLVGCLGEHLELVTREQPGHTRPDARLHVRVAAECRGH